MWVLPSGVTAHPDLHEQEAAVDRAIADDPETAALHLHRGQVMVEKKDWDSALASFARALALGADRDQVALLQGATYLEAGWPRMATVRFEAVIERAPQRSEAYLGRARAWRALEHPELAAADFERAFERAARPSPTEVLEWEQAFVAAGDKEAALAALDRATARIGPVPAVLLAAVELCAELERPEDALRHLDLLLAQSPDHPVWLARRGDLLDLAGRGDEAHASYRRALTQIEARSQKRESRRLAELEQQLRAQLSADSTGRRAEP